VVGSGDDVLGRREPMRVEDDQRVDTPNGIEALPQARHAGYEVGVVAPADANAHVLVEHQCRYV
jgi:hypothetical protein